MRLVWVVIPLVLFGIVGIQESFAEESELIASPRHQLESGIAPENIQCREDRVLVLRTNGNPSCVKYHWMSRTHISAANTFSHGINPSEKYLFNFPNKDSK